jgi:hypothetical protein
MREKILRCRERMMEGRKDRGKEAGMWKKNDGEWSCGGRDGGTDGGMDRGWRNGGMEGSGDRRMDGWREEWRDGWRGRGMQRCRLKGGTGRNAGDSAMAVTPVGRPLPCLLFLPVTYEVSTACVGLCEMEERGS